MDNKFYVSYEAARLLKEKGYNEECYAAIDEDNDIFEGEYRMNQDLPEWKWSAPTKSEAIDWLESKGIVVMLYMYSILYEDYTIKGCWGYRILQGDELLFTDNSSNTPTRLEAEEAAIIKACELLNEKEE